MMAQLILSGVLILFWFVNASCMEGTSQGAKQNLSVIVKTSDDELITFDLSSIVHLPILKKLVQDIQVDENEEEEKQIVFVPFGSKILYGIRLLAERLTRYGFSNTAVEADSWPAQAVITGGLGKQDLSLDYFIKLIEFIKAADFLGNKPMTTVGCKQLNFFLKPVRIPQEMCEIARQTVSSVSWNIQEPEAIYPGPFEIQWKIPNTTFPQALSCCENIIAVGDKNALRFFSLDLQNETLKSFGSHEETTKKYIFSPNGYYSAYFDSHEYRGTFFMYLYHKGNFGDCMANLLPDQESYALDDNGTLYLASKEKGIQKRGIKKTKHTMLEDQRSGIVHNMIHNLFCCSSDGNILAWGKKSGIKVYDTQRKNLTFLSHKNLKQLSFFDRFLVSLGTNAVKIWDLKKELFPCRAISKISINNAEMVALNARDGYMAMIHDGAIALVDCGSKVIFHRTKFNAGPIKRISCDQATGSFVAITDSELAVWPAKRAIDNKQACNEFVQNQISND